MITAVLFNEFNDYGLMFSDKFGKNNVFNKD